MSKLIPIRIIWATNTKIANAPMGAASVTVTKAEIEGSEELFKFLYKSPTPPNEAYLLPNEQSLYGALLEKLEEIEKNPSHFLTDPDENKRKIAQKLLKRERKDE